MSQVAQNEAREAERTAARPSGRRQLMVLHLLARACRGLAYVAVFLTTFELVSGAMLLLVSVRAGLTVLAAGVVVGGVIVAVLLGFSEVIETIIKIDETGQDNAERLSQLIAEREATKQNIG